MNISLHNFNEIISLYGIPPSVVSFSYFLNGYDSKPREAKVITKVEMSEGNAFVVKCTNENMHPNFIIEKQSEFSELLRNNGILTPKRYKSNGKYCIKYNIDDSLFDVTVEDFFGTEIKTLDYDLAYKIGSLMANIHGISEKGKFFIGANTIFNVCGYNEMSGYNKFLELGKNGKLNERLFHEINQLYLEKMNNIMRVWSKLPKFATQGDASINNLTYVNSELGIFDYNISGDEVFIGDMILEGLLTANEMDLAYGLTDKDRKKLFLLFYKGYTDNRKLTDDEKLILNDVYAVSSSLWATKITSNDNSLEELIKNNKMEVAEKKLKDIYFDLCDDQLL